MQALILVGGEGTRLRPLTSGVPKPIVPLVDRPFMAYMLEWLQGHGIDRVVFSLGFLADSIRDVLGDGSDFDVELTYVEEPEPLGTGGAVKFAEHLLDDRFVMLNGDVLTDIDLSAQIEQHERWGARATLALVPVEDPTAYGLVRLNDDQSVSGFLEKPDPDEIDTDLINAGVYVLERDLLDRFQPGSPASIERDLFPGLVGDGLYGVASRRAYWLDIGTPARYLEATFDILERAVMTEAGATLGSDGRRIDDGVENEGTIVGPAVVGAGCRIGAGAQIGPRAVLGPGVQVGAGAIVANAVVLEGATVGPHAVVEEAIVAPGAVIGAETRIERGAVIGQGVQIGAHNVVANDARVFSGTTIPDGGLLF